MAALIRNKPDNKLNVSDFKQKPLGSPHNFARLFFFF